MERRPDAISDACLWLNRARSSLALARSRPPDVVAEDLCFAAQQAAEKAIKAVFVARGQRFPFTHDLVRLLALLEADGEPIPAPVREAALLNRFAVVTRYPGFAEDVTWQEYRQAVAVAQEVVRWAEARAEPAEEQA